MPATFISSHLPDIIPTTGDFVTLNNELYILSMHRRVYHSATCVTTGAVWCDAHTSFRSLIAYLRSSPCFGRFIKAENITITESV